MKCPVCSDEMSRRTSYDVDVDVCAEHGIWLEKGELARIVDTVAERERPPAWQAESERRDGRYEGIFFGWLSLLLPK